ncbi:anaerobic ribonucleoside triphosphate reductase [Desulfovibrio cuneatus]|uniref:anaerobic ribonucleoside triphosphate reductase n=1 Tax=Desulfovibrio cuneatus TaxID=159728 RepID=UPI000418F9A7|nr:anaerobic ribonucleoside triphosphate reductase [Desulfovibrio cuneatus]
MAKQIVKRDGCSVLFDSSKILNAIAKANKAVGEEEITATGLLFVTEEVCRLLEARSLSNVEEIQDVVEEVLIRFGFSKTAKAYILYRAEHTKIRDAETYLMDIYKKLTWAPAKEEDIKRENANIDGDTAMGTMLRYGSEGSKFFIDNYVLPKDAAAGHANGDIHIHDKDFYMLTETCCQIDLIRLFKKGFSTGHGYLREPNSIESYAALACIALQANQNEMHGGQSIPNFDFAMAQGVNKTFRKEYVAAFACFLEVKNELDAAEAVARTEVLLQGLPYQPTLGNGEAFGQALLACHGETMRPLLAKTHLHATQKAIQATRRRTYQAMEAFIHNLNTMNSRAGAQVPFSSVNYGTDVSAEGRMVVENLLLATKAGLGNGETSIFPVQIFKVKAGVSFNPEDPNYDLFRLAMETSARRLFPNFSFLDAPFNAQYYREGDYNSEVAYMGCRTRVIGNVYDTERQVTCGRGNLSFTTVNLPRLGLEAKGNTAAFFTLLDERIDLVFRQLLHRFKVQGSKKVYNYPFLMGQGIWLDSEHLKWEDSIEEVLKHGTLTIGFIGLAEALYALLGKHHGQCEQAQALGLQIVQHLRRRADEKARETGLNFSLIATPAEGLSGRFVALDKQRYGTLEGITDKDYYTNSFHVPVSFSIAAFRKIQLEAPYHALTNAGHISYVELDGDASKNLEAFETIVRFMHAQGVGYGSINHPLDRDPVCGYIGVIDDCCPRCGRKEGEGVSEEALLQLKKQYHDVPM